MSLKYISLILLFLALHTSAHAGGFFVANQSASGAGTSTAGSITGLGDGSSVFYNPSAMSLYDKPMFSFGGHVSLSSVEFTDSGSNIASFPIAGDLQSDGGKNVWVPNIYGVYPVTEKLNVGLAVTGPFGLVTDFGPSWVGRYDAIRSELRVLNLSSGASYRVTDNFSFGAAIGAYYSDSELTNAVDFGSIGLSTLGPEASSVIGLSPQANDGLLSLEGDDWSPVVTLGLLYTYGDESQNRVGLTYRSKSDVDIKGSAQFSVPQIAQPLQLGGAFLDSAARTSVTLPQSISLGLRHEVVDGLIVLYDVEWMDWSKVKELDIAFSNMSQPNLTQEIGWRSSWRHSLGAIYELSSDIDLLSGVSLDYSPSKGGSLPSARIPDSNRYWASIGMRYRVKDSLRIDVSYSHAFFEGKQINSVSPTGSQLLGDFDLQMDIISVSLNYL